MSRCAILPDSKQLSGVAERAERRITEMSFTVWNKNSDIFRAGNDLFHLPTKVMEKFFLCFFLKPDLYILFPSYGKLRL